MRAPSPARRMAGLSMVELMIALTIGVIVMLGVVQVFAASRAAYQLSDGLARVQENSRFAMDTLQRELRMAGHFGCVNDQARQSPDGVSLFTTFAATPHPALDFQRSIQGYEATDTAPGDAVTLPATPATGGTAYTPALPDEFAAALPNRVNGSDIVALRYLMPDGVPVTASGGTVAQPVFSFDKTRLAVLQSGVADSGLYGAADCASATVFQARSIDKAGGTITFGDAPNNASNFIRPVTAGQAMLHRAESAVYYVGYDAASARSSLYRVRFNATPNGALVAGAPEALVEGVENMQLLYGQDRRLTSAYPTGFIDRQGTAATVQASANPNINAWRRVGAVQMGLVMASPDPSAAPQADQNAVLTSMGVTFTAPEDGRMRAVYQTTIALRNRLFGN
ncbi:PilW family protein [Stenotrophomonas maltophilia]|jgi:type IV pilus assembly protein PilW|uniref:Pilus assembly protein PilW n=2 Tax=Gammaproteobacteria TaxID=1236 RepID=A0AAP7GUW2_STEMA|nr:PilW family protein [Stenotrophomonas maltophilia]OBU63391.1 pilus assembly protein PilW [Stenotrophomonas maltophilia]